MATLLKFPERKNQPADNQAIEYAERLTQGLRSGEYLGFAAIVRKMDGSLASILTASCGNAAYKAAVSSKLQELARRLA